jgi:hypothetical protein
MWLALITYEELIAYKELFQMCRSSYNRIEDCVYTSRSSEAGAGAATHAMILTCSLQPIACPGTSAWKS